MKYTKYIISLLVFSLIFGCAPHIITKKEEPHKPPEMVREKIPKKKPVKLPEEPPEKEIVKKTYEKAEREYEEGKFKQAIKDFEDFVTRFPSSNLVDDALFKMGEIYFVQGNYNKSAAIFQQVLEDFPTTKLYNKAGFKLAISHLKLKNLQDSTRILRSLVSRPLEEEEEAQLYLLLAQNYQELNKYVAAISWYVKAIDIQNDRESIKKIEYTVKEIVNNRLSKDELIEIIYHYRAKFPSGYAAFKLAEIYLKEREFGEASLTLTRMLSMHPTHEYKLEAQKLLNEVNQRLRTDVKAIGCILPLTGEYSVYGEKTLHGIELAADVFNPSPKGIPIKVIIKDSKADPRVAATAVEELVLEDNVICIIGPLLSVTSEAAAKKAEELKVPMVVLSQKSRIPEIGEYIFQNSLTPELQTKTIVDCATGTLRLKRFAILYPNNRYGNSFMNLFWDEVLTHGGEIVGVESYESEQNDFQDEIKKLVGLYYTEDRKDEMEEMNSESEGDEEEELKPIIDFDAIFIPDYYDKVGLIIPQLAYYDVVGMKLLGTNGWNSLKLIEMAGQYVQGAIFVDGFFKDSPYPFVQKFVDDFRSAFGEEPHVLEAQAYDSANIVIDLIRNQGVESRDELKEGLREIKDYPGVSGATSFNEKGDSHKILYILTVMGRNIVQLR
ncbi:MAG: penicillin-binding protein activator [Pseudomonadota bacterium]